MRTIFPILIVFGAVIMGAGCSSAVLQQNPETLPPGRFSLSVSFSSVTSEGLKSHVPIPTLFARVGISGNSELGIRGMVIPLEDGLVNLDGDWKIRLLRYRRFNVSLDNQIALTSTPDVSLVAYSPSILTRMARSIWCYEGYHSHEYGKRERHCEGR